MGFSESFSKFMDKRKKEKEEFQGMEREERLKRKLEQKMKSPAQKEHEFYQREKATEQLNELVKREKKERDIKMKELSNPFNKQNIFRERLDIKDGNFRI